MSEKTINPHKFAVFVTERQLWIIREFLDICSFLLLGNFENPLWNLFLSRELDYHEFHKQANELKRVVFPELDRNSWYGVGWTDDDSRQNKAQIAYEIQAMLNHEIKLRVTDSAPGLSDMLPLHYSTEALIRVEDLADEETKDERIARLEAEVERRDEILRRTLTIAFNGGNVFSPAAAKNEYWIVATNWGEISERFASPYDACEAYLELERERAKKLGNI